MPKKFNAEAVRREVSRCYMKADGSFDLDAIWAAVHVEESALYGLVKKPDAVLDLLERAYGEDNICYRKGEGDVGLGVGPIRKDDA